ncbi:unnamed protein product [Closterium sp. NIES-54]
MENLMYKDWKAENEANIGMRFGEVKSSGLEHVELPLVLSSSSTTTRQSSLVNGGEEAKDAEEEEEEVQQPAKSALAGAALMVGEDEESDYEECAFVFFSPVEMPGEPATLKEALESSDAEEWKKAMESELKSIEENGTWELGWLMWDPKSNTIFTTRDAKFMEGLMFKEWSERGRSKVTIPLGIEVRTNDPLLIPIELSSSSELTEVSHDLGGAEEQAADVEEVLQQGEAPIADRGDSEEELQQPTPSAKLPPRRRTQWKRDAVRGGAKEGAAKERPKRSAHPRDFLKYEWLGVPKALLVQEEEYEEEKGAEGEMEQICCFGVNLPHEPASMEQALAGDDREAWLASRDDEFQSHMENETWTLTNLPPGRKALDCTWVLRAPTLWLLLAAAAVCGWKVEQMDVKTAFLYGVVDEEIYMKQPEGYDDGSGRILLVYVDDILLSSPSLERIKEVQGKLKETFQCKALGPVGYYLGLHVERDEVKGWLRLHQHKYLAAMGEKYGLEEGRSVKTPLPSGFQLHLNEEEGEVLEYELQRRFQSMVGSLMYASVNTRPDIAFSVSQLARVVSRPLQEHLDAAERLVRYCMATSRVGLQYSVHGQLKQKGVEEVSTKTGAPARRGHLYLSCFTDATWASDISDATSHGGYICCVGGSPVSWKSKKQGEIAHSSTESEYMALFHGVKEVVWMRRLLEEMGQEQEGPTPVFCDSQGAIAMALPPPGENIVDGMWIFRVKLGSPPVFNAPYVARGFSQRQGVDYFQTFSSRLHLHEEIWLRRPPGFTGSFCAGTQSSLWRPVYDLRKVPREWHDALRTTIAAPGFAPSTADASLFLRTDPTVPPFYILVYADDLVFATADTEALALVKVELQMRHICTDLGELRSYLGLQITRDRARCTTTLTQSHMVHQVLQHFRSRFSSPQPTLLATGHSLSATPSDESVKPSGPYLELVGCLMYQMTCTRPDLAYPLSILARFVAPGVSLEGALDSCAEGTALLELCWLTYGLTDSGERPHSLPVLYVDNKAMIALCEEQRLEHRMKHIALRYFLARELQQRGQLRLAYVASRVNTSDVFTKALGSGDH